MTIKKWFMEKEFDSSERYAISTADDPTVVRETEKAVLLKWVTDCGTLTHWVPKICILTDAEPIVESVAAAPDQIVAGMAVVNPAGQTVIVKKVAGQIVIGANGKQYFIGALRVA